MPNATPSPGRDPVVTLKCGGQIYTGWKSVVIQRSIETIAGAFALTMSDYDPALRKVIVLAPPQAAELSVDGVLLLTGYIDDCNVEFDSDHHEVRIVGRDRTGDLVDSAAYIPGYNPGIWGDNTSVLLIVSQIIQPFSLTVKADVDAGTATIFALQPGETAFTAIDRICKEAAVLPISDGVGGLLLTRGGMGGSFAPLIEGQNILSAKGSNSFRDRFSDYYTFADDSDYVPDGAQPQANFGVAHDPALAKRWRPTFITVDFKDGPTQDKMQARAQWEASVHAGQSLRHSIKVQGWRDDHGQLWQPNGLVQVTSPKLGVDQQLLIVDVTFTLDENGSVTTLTVTLPDAFKLVPLADDSDYIVPGAGAPQ